MAMRPRRPSVPATASKYGKLKAEEQFQQNTGERVAGEDPLEMGPLKTDLNEDIYTKKMQRTDEDLARAKAKGRTRMPGKQPGLAFNKGGKVKGKK